MNQHFFWMLIVLTQIVCKISLMATTPLETTKKSYFCQFIIYNDTHKNYCLTIKIVSMLGEAGKGMQLLES